jgi:hypothetical protein
MATVRRVSVLARLDESPLTLADAQAAAAAGDESWEQWVAEYHRGDALILRLELTIEIANGAVDVVRTCSGGFFVENDPHTPNVERQVAELATADLSALTSELAARDLHIDVNELGGMYIHVHLDDDVRRQLGAVATDIKDAGPEMRLAGGTQTRRRGSHSRS